MQKVEAIIVGGGPCGLAAAIELQNIGLSPVIIEKGNIVNAIYNYPTHQTFLVRVKSWQSGMCRLLLNNENRNAIRHLSIIAKS